jgi:hypothetical protein
LIHRRGQSNIFKENGAAGDDFSEKCLIVWQSECGTAALGCSWPKKWGAGAP